MGFLDLAVVATAFILILPAELPDKTFVATLVLSTRFKHLHVWIGVAAAFAVQCLLAVVAGGVIALLPQRIVLAVSGILFIAGAVIMGRAGFKARAEEDAAEQEEADEINEKVGSSVNRTTFRVIATCFMVLFTAEFGDLSQLLVAGLAASTGSPASVWLGSWLALALIAGVAVIFGSWLQRRVALWRIRLVSSVLLLGLATWTIVEFIRVTQ